MDINKLITKAKKDCANSQYALGLCLALGYGIEKDNNKALDWMISSAKLGNKSAKLSLGGYWSHCFEEKYLKRFKQCFNAADLASRYNLAKCFYKGIGFDVNYDLARQLLEDILIGDELKSVSSAARKACEVYLKMPSIVGREYIEPDHITGEDNDGRIYHDWHFKIKNFWSNRDDRSSEDINIDDLIEKANQDCADSQFALGLCYACGYGVSKNAETAGKWIYKAERLGNYEARNFIGYELLEYLDCNTTVGRDDYDVNYYLGLCFLNGCGVSQDYNRAYDLWNEILANVYDNQQKHLIYSVAPDQYITPKVGADYAFSKFPTIINEAPYDDSEQEEGFIDDEIKYYIANIDNYLAKAKQGEYDAMYSIWKLTCGSRASLDARNIPIEPAKEWLLKSAEGGYVLAQYALGLCYMEEYDIHEIEPNAFCYECFINKYCHCKSNEKLSAYIPDNYDFGFEKDVDKSLYWLIKAARQKHLPAIAMLDIHYDHMVDINIKLEEVA